MNKPKPRTKKYYDWIECKNYIQEKYNIDIRDVAGKYQGNPDAPYQDFWHSLTDKFEIHNGCYVDFFAGEPLDEWFEHEWEKKIARIFEEEFYVEGKEIEFYIWW